MRAARPGCKALMAHYGIGALTAVTILAELGDCTPVLLLARTRSATPGWKCWHQTAPPVAAILV